MNRQQVEERLAPVVGLDTRVVTPAVKAFTAGPVGEDGRPSLVFKGGGRSYEVSKQGLASAVKVLDIPGDYLKRCPPELALPQLNYWTNRAARLRVVTRGDTIQTILPPSVMPIPQDRVLDTLDKSMGGPDYDRAYIGHDTAEIYAVSVRQSQQKAVAKGDLVSAGVYVATSPTGVTLPTVKAYAMRLVCTNGMVSQVDWGQFKFEGNGNGGNLSEFWPWLRNSIRQALNQLGGEVERLKELRGTRIEGQASGLLEGLYAQYRIPDVLRRTISARVIDERPATLYDLLNTVTQVASHDVEDGRVVHRLMSVGGAIQSAIARCPACHRAMPGHVHSSN